MLKKEVVLRNEIYTIFSSEKQQRMSVYFALNEEFNKCLQKCTNLTDDQREECGKDCESIYDQYTEKLKERYQGEDKKRINMEVNNLPPFNSKKRQDRTGFFYELFGITFKELVYGKDQRAAFDSGEDFKRC